MAPRKVIIDTDPGVDDIMALLLALSASPEELDVVMISATYGNVPLQRHAMPPPLPSLRARPVTGVGLERRALRCIPAAAVNTAPLPPLVVCATSSPSSTCWKRNSPGARRRAAPRATAP